MLKNEVENLKNLRIENNNLVLKARDKVGEQSEKKGDGEPH